MLSAFVLSGIILYGSALQPNYVFGLASNRESLGLNRRDVQIGRVHDDNSIIKNEFCLQNNSKLSHYSEMGIWKSISDALWAFSPEPEGNVECARHTKLFKKHIAKNTLWAVQMLESSALAASGVLSGNTDHLGHFDSCLGVELMSEGLAGQYCLPSIYLAPTIQAYPAYHTGDYTTDPFSLHYPAHLSAWDKIKLTPDPSKKVRNVLRWALCLPASCQVVDILPALNIILASLWPQGMQVHAELTERACTSKADTAGATGTYYIIKWLLLLSVAGVVVASSYDILVYRKNIHQFNPQGKVIQLMLSYSVYENLCSLKKSDPSSELAAIHGIRTYSMFLIILGHRCLFTYGGPFFNPEFLEYRYRRFEDMLLLNGTLIVDTFFVLSGFLTCYMISLELDNTRKLKLTNIYIYRWLRITPMYMLMVAFYAGLLPFLGDGPLWKLKAGLEAERCQRNWWTNLLYINNYVNADQLCMFQSWYISCDMHYFLAVLLVVHKLWHKPRVGVVFLSLALALATAVPFLVTYFGRYDGVLRAYMSLLSDPVQVDYYRNIYIKSHNRAVPYVVGVSAAYLYKHLKNAGFKFTVNQMRVGAVITAVVALGSMTSAWLFYIPGRAYSALENALYSSLHRVGWSMAMSWIVVAGGLSGFGVLDPILCLQSLVPLSRLTYSAFLVHGLVQLYSVATLRSPEYMSFPKLFWMWLGDVMASFLLALLMYLLLEAPLVGVLKLLLQRKCKVESKEMYEKALVQPSIDGHEDESLGTASGKAPDKPEVLAPELEEEAM